MTRPGRTPGLEAARALATIVVVAGHAALSYMETPIGWAVQDTSRSVVVDFLVWVGRQVAMPCFFFLAGYSARAVLARGAASFVRQRLRRLALPLVVLLVPMSIATTALWSWGRALVPRGSVAAGVPALRSSGLPVNLGHLWYLYYLLVLSALLLVAVAATRAVRRGAPAAPPGGEPRLARWGAFPVVLAVPTAACLFVAGKLQLDTPLGFAVDPVIAAYFATFFVGGYLAHAWPATLTTAAAHCGRHALVAAALVGGTVPALLASRTAGGAPPPAFAWLTSAASSWFLVCALLGASVRWLSRPGPWLGAVGAASYWTYLVHLPLVVLLQVVASQLTLPGPVEYAVIAGTGIAAPVWLYTRAIGRTSLARVV